MIWIASIFALVYICKIHFYLMVLAFRNYNLSFSIIRFSQTHPQTLSFFGHISVVLGSILAFNTDFTTENLIRKPFLIVAGYIMPGIGVGFFNLVILECWASVVCSIKTMFSMLRSSKG